MNTRIPALAMLLACASLTGCVDVEGDLSLDQQTEALSGTHLRAFHIASGYYDTENPSVLEAHAPMYDRSQDFALRGLCVRATNNKISTIKALMVAIKQNGEIDDTAIWELGGDEPNHATERCVDVGEGNLIVGLSGRIQGADVTHLQAYYLPWNAAELRLEGTQPKRKLADGQTDVVEEAKLMISDFMSGTNTLSRAFVSGVGLRESGGDLTNIAFQVRSVCRRPSAAPCETETW